MKEAVIVDAVRTPVGRYGGALAKVRPDDMGALVVREVVRRSGVDTQSIEDVIFGCTNQAGEDNRNVARMVSLLAGLPFSVAGVTVNRLCGSGLEAIIQARRAIALGEGEVFIAGGVESMTRAPLAMPKPEFAFQRGSVTVYDSTIGWRFPNPRMEAIIPLEEMGETAENVAEQYHITREDQDLFGLESQRRAVAAIESGRFKDEIVPVELPQRKGPPVVVDTDEHPRADTTLEKLAALRPVFREGGTVTAGTSSGINDGAAALLVMERKRAESLGYRPMVRILAAAVAGVHPGIMGIGPIPATRKVLHRAGLTVEDLDLVELNEAFASQSLACIRELGLDVARVNVNGGAIALGHPLGCTGAKIATTLVHEMRRRGARYGLVTMCIGVGQGIAMVVESVG